MADTILIIGASSAIAQALSKHWLLQQPEVNQVLISRQAFNTRNHAADNSRLTWLQSDYSEHSINAICIDLFQQSDVQITHIFICNGILHQQSIAPEKRIESLKQTNLQQLLHINMIIPSLWVSQLAGSMLKNQVATSCTLTVFSARIGSIEDNRSGGWYSYRSSKAALNMFLKTASIELGRRLPNLKLVSFHPGTTDTPLSKPFQKNVPADKLFEPAFVAEQLYQHVHSRQFDGTLDYIDWQGHTIPW